MNKKFRMEWLILVIGIVLGLGHWQQKGQAAPTITVTSPGDGAANDANCPNKPLDQSAWEGWRHTCDSPAHTHIELTRFRSV